MGTPETKNQAAFWAGIEAAPADRYLTASVVDWGGMPRGAGKRVGGMVMGAMSGAVLGKKTYSDILGRAPLSDEERVEAKGMEKPQQVLMARALAAGHCPEVAFLVAYTVGPEPVTRAEAYGLALDHIANDSGCEEDRMCRLAHLHGAVA